MLGAIEKKKLMSNGRTQIDNNHRHKALWRNPHLWYTAAIMTACSIFYYLASIIDFMGWPNPQWNILYTVHDLHRLLFLIPVLYAAYIFRVRGVIIVTLISILVFLPRAMFISPYPDALLRVITSVIFIGGFGILIAGLLDNITKRQQLEEKLRESNEINFNLLEQSPHPVVVVGLDRAIKRVNKSLENLTGYSASEVIGLKTPYPWWTGQNHEKKSDRDRDAALARKGKRFEERFHKKNGELFWAEVTPMAIIIDGKLKYYMYMWTDITERKKAEEELRGSNEFNSNFIEQAPHPILVTDWDTTITKVNRALEQLTGYSSSEIIGRKAPFPWWTEETTQDKSDRDKAAALEGKSRRFEERFRKKNGETFWVEMTPTAVLIEGKPRYWVNRWIDITERKKMEKELQEGYHQEKKLRQELDEEIKKRIDFTRIIIHELKTPLTSIMVSSDLLTTEAKEQLLLELSQSINRSAVNLNSRIDELLDMARGEMGMLKLNLRPVDPRQLLSTLANDMNLVVSSRRQSLNLEVPDSLPQVKADEDRLRQIVLNFLSNASKFTPGGSNIILRAKEKASSLIVEVEDNGPGIAQEEQERLFQPYYRVEQGKERTSGLGLGLALSKTLVELHEGKIWVKSKLGQGSTFGFSIPLKAANSIGSQKKELERHTVKARANMACTATGGRNTR